MTNYFELLFKSSPGNYDEVVNNIPTTINDQQNRILTRRITYEEAKQAAFSMHPDKSPGPDSLIQGFYQTYWDVIGGDVVDLCNHFLISTKLQSGLNNTNLVLIPKTLKPQSMKDLRLIALCNVLYKILTKILATRLKSVLGSVISENQSAFVSGRSITDNIIVAFETQHYINMKRQGKEDFVAVKADMSKAFD